MSELFKEIQGRDERAAHPGFPRQRTSGPLIPTESWLTALPLTSGCLTFDSNILGNAEKIGPFDIQTIGLQLASAPAKQTAGVGKRSDMPMWCEDGTPRQHCPILLSVAAEILNDQALATQAVDRARHQ